MSPENLDRSRRTASSRRLEVARQSHALHVQTLGATPGRLQRAAVDRRQVLRLHGAKQHHRHHRCRPMGERALHGAEEHTLDRVPVPRRCK